MRCLRWYALTRVVFFFFFFQAEDGIRDYKVTGVQTCALPILSLRPLILAPAMDSAFLSSTQPAGSIADINLNNLGATILGWLGIDPAIRRSEERRVGKECRSRWSPYH